MSKYRTPKNETERIHGGDLETASRLFGLPNEDWLDLSTGISPLPYPHTEVSRHSLTRMPYQQACFDDAVRAYYADLPYLATNGSQQVISVLPNCLDDFPIALPDIGYKEHEKAWAEKGREIIRYPSHDVAEAESFINDLICSGRTFHLLVINPNNPSCSVFPPFTLNRWANNLLGGGALIIDEAFVDIEPKDSALTYGLTENMIVLRSFGKFFGLPGLRIGFVFANETLLGRLRHHVGIWDVNGPAQEIATRALNDVEWQNEARQKLVVFAEANRTLWKEFVEALKSQEILISQAHHPLFSSYMLPKKKAVETYHSFAQHGVLLRLIPIDAENSILRVGRVDVQEAYQVKRLQGVIKDVCSNCF